MNGEKINRWGVMIAAVLALVSATATTALAEAGDGFKTKFVIENLGTFQAIQDYDSRGARGQVAPGMQAAVSNWKLWCVKPGLEIFTEVWNSSRNHRGTVYDFGGWILLSQLPEEDNILGLNDSLLKVADFKAGHFELDYGDHWMHETDNADSSRNPLVGNFLTSAHIDHAGLELIGKPGDLRWLVGVDMANTSESFVAGKGFGTHAKITFEPKDSPIDLRVSLSGMRIDNSEATPSVTTGGYGSARTGSRYVGVIERGGSWDGQTTFGQGKDVTAFQLDLAATIAGLSLYSNLGTFSDADENGTNAGTPNSNWIYFAGETSKQVNDRAHLAVRGSVAKCSTFYGNAVDATIGRLQVGGGYWLTKDLLIKTEYVYQRYFGMDSFGTAYANSASFSGVVTEVYAPITLFDNIGK